MFDPAMLIQIASCLGMSQNLMYHSAGHRGMKPGTTDGLRSLASVPYSPQQDNERVGTTLILVPRGASNLFSRRGLGMRKRVVSHEVL